MNDAAEVLLCIYEKAMDVAKALGRRSGIDETFGLQARMRLHAAGLARLGTGRDLAAGMWAVSGHAASLLLPSSLLPCRWAMFPTSYPSHVPCSLLPPRCTRR